MRIFLTSAALMACAFILPVTVHGADVSATVDMPVIHGSVEKLLERKEWPSDAERDAYIKKLDYTDKNIPVANAALFPSKTMPEPIYTSSAAWIDNRYVLIGLSVWDTEENTVRKIIDTGPIVGVGIGAPVCLDPKTKLIHTWIAPWSIKDLPADLLERLNSQAYNKNSHFFEDVYKAPDGTQMRTQTFYRAKVYGYMDGPMHTLVTRQTQTQRQTGVQFKVGGPKYDNLDENGQPVGPSDPVLVYTDDPAVLAKAKVGDVYIDPIDTNTPLRWDRGNMQCMFRYPRDDAALSMWQKTFGYNKKHKLWRVGDKVYKNVEGEAVEVQDTTRKSDWSDWNYQYGRVYDEVNDHYFLYPSYVSLYDEDQDSRRVLWVSKNGAVDWEYLPTVPYTESPPRFHRIVFPLETGHFLINEFIYNPTNGELQKVPGVVQSKVPKRDSPVPRFWVEDSIISISPNLCKGLALVPMEDVYTTYVSSRSKKLWVIDFCEGFKRVGAQ